MTRSYNSDRPKKDFRGRQDRNDHQPAFRPARKLDPDSCPPGYDPDVWSMTLLFIQLAEDHGIILQAGKMILYSLLDRRMEELREKLEDARESRRGSWSADGVTRFSSWQELGEAAIRREWSEYIQDEHAAGWFCGKVRFWQMVKEVRTRGHYLRLASEAEKISAEREASGDYDQEFWDNMKRPQAPKKARPKMVVRDYEA